jgi:hypothetical protein
MIGKGRVRVVAMPYYVETKVSNPRAQTRCSTHVCNLLIQVYAVIEYKIQDPVELKERSKRVIFGRHGTDQQEPSS